MKTDTVLKKEGIETLIETMGYVDAERFIMLLKKDSFDYTAWRSANLNQDMSVRELSRMAMQALAKNNFR